MVWLEDWAKRIPIETDQTKIDEDLTDFPVLITLSGSEVFDALTVSGGADAYDILFLDSRGDQSSIGAAVKYTANGAVYGCYPQTISGIKCIYSDGSNDMLYCDDNAAYDLGTVDFTIEAWVRPTLLSSPYRIMGHGELGTTNGTWAFGLGYHSTWGTGTRLNVAVRSSSTIYNLSSDDVSAYITVNTWNHIAVVRSAGTLFFYLNGIQRGSVACNYDLTVASYSALYLNYLVINGTFADIFFGYISKWRLSKDIARYTSDFTPPTTYVNDSYTKLIYMAENDISPQEQVLNQYGEVNVTRASTPFNRNASWDCVAGSDDYLRIDNNAAFDLGSNDFTIDGWAYIKSYDASYRYIISKRTPGSYTWLLLGVNNAGYFKAYMSNNNSAWQIEFVGAYVPVNNWFHFALVRNGTTVDLYYNGIKTNTGTFTGVLYNNSGILTYVGQGDNGGGGDWYGYIYGLRVSKGIARYSDNFTPGDPLEFNSSFTNRKKIAITDANNSQLYVEVERWDHANKKAWLWTKVPTVVSGTNTKLYFYYDKTKSDNTNYVGDTASIPARQVWDENFVAVYHMSTTPFGNYSIKDSTVSGTHATPTDYPLLTDGMDGKAMGFDGSNDYARTDTRTWGFSTTSTFECLVKASSLPSDKFLTSLAHTSYSDELLSILNWGNQPSKFSYLQHKINANYWSRSSLSNISAGIWYFFSATVSGNGSNIEVFIDGQKNSGVFTTFGSPTSIVDTTPRRLNIAIRQDGSGISNVVVDELRFSKIVRSDAWIKATYYSSWNDLILFGSSEDPPYFFYEGYVNVQGIPSARKVHLHRRSTGQCVDSTTSSGTTGYFKLQSRYPDYHYVIILSDLNEGFSLLSDDKIHPEI